VNQLQMSIVQLDAAIDQDTALCRDIVRALRAGGDETLLRFLAELKVEMESPCAKTSAKARFTSLGVAIGLKSLLSASVEKKP